MTFLKLMRTALSKMEIKIIKISLKLNNEYFLLIKIYSLYFFIE
jgi:hypothetical protein